MANENLQLCPPDCALSRGHKWKERKVIGRLLRRSYRASWLIRAVACCPVSGHIQTCNCEGVLLPSPRLPYNFTGLRCQTTIFLTSPLMVCTILKRCVRDVLPRQHYRRTHSPKLDSMRGMTVSSGEILGGNIVLRMVFGIFQVITSDSDLFYKHFCLLWVIKEPGVLSKVLHAIHSVQHHTDYLWQLRSSYILAYYSIKPHTHKTASKTLKSIIFPFLMHILVCSA